MKRILLLLTSFAALTASAQRSPKFTQQEPLAPQLRPAAQRIENNTTHPAVQASERGSVLFNEDFSNGLDGSTAFGAWTVGDNADNTIWHLAGPSSPDGPIAGTLPGLSATGTTSANGWMIFDPDQYIGNNPSWDDASGSYTSGYLQSPELNLSSLGSVLVDFNQYFIYCCFPTSPLTVDVSLKVILSSLQTLNLTMHSTPL
jgi:hypothetical protein